MSHALTREDLPWCWLRFHVPDAAFGAAVRDDLELQRTLPPAVWIQLEHTGFTDAKALWTVRHELARTLPPAELRAWLDDALPDEPFLRFLMGDGAVKLGAELKQALQQGVGADKFEKRRIKGELCAALAPEKSVPDDAGPRSLQRLRLAVLRHWDPLGAASAQRAPHHYDRLLPWIKVLLDGGRPEDELAAYLAEHAPGALQLDGDVHRRAAQTLRAVWAEA